eukprot:4595514-Prorocentrum_lima.AAC.1
MQEAIRESLIETGVRESDISEDAAMAIAIERSRIETTQEMDLDPGAASSAAPIAKRWPRPTASKSTAEAKPEPMP